MTDEVGFGIYLWAESRSFRLLEKLFRIIEWCMNFLRQLSILYVYWIARYQINFSISSTKTIQYMGLKVIVNASVAAWI